MALKTFVINSSPDNIGNIIDYVLLLYQLSVINVEDSFREQPEKKNYNTPGNKIEE